MDILTLERLMPLLGLLGLLLLVWLVVRVRTGGLAGLAKGPARNPIDVRAVRPLGDGTRAILMSVAGTEVLVLSHRKAGAQVLPLPAGPGETPDAAPAAPGPVTGGTA